MPRAKQPMLELACLSLHLGFKGPARFPRWLGSAFRGGLGQHLKRISCYHPMRECEGCDLARGCLFYAAYENPFAKKGHAPPPRPIILVPPFFGKVMEFERDAELRLKLLMFGDYARYFPYVILALQQFGSHGLGNARHFGQNRFEVLEARCEFSGKTVYDGGTIYPSNMRALDARELPSVKQRQLRVGFRTPIQCKLGFPPTATQLLRMIRARLLRFVNEYGDGSRVPEPKVKGEVRTLARHYQRLVGYSKRSGRREFWHCWTGIAEYKFERLGSTASWLLGVGKLLGAGPKSSFGLGFLDISPASKEKSTK